MADSIDHSKAWLSKDGYVFAPFLVPSQGKPLQKAHLGPRKELLVFERRGVRRAVLMQQMAYHHVAQGKLAGEPYLISF